MPNCRLRTFERVDYDKWLFPGMFGRVPLSLPLHRCYTFSLATAFGGGRQSTTHSAIVAVRSIIFESCLSSECRMLKESRFLPSQAILVGTENIARRRRSGSTPCGEILEELIWQTADQHRKTA